MDCWAFYEMCRVVVPHGRSKRNVALITRALFENAGSSFSAAVGHACRQAATRLFSNVKTTVPDLMAGHFSRTMMRCGSYSLILVAQDTTFVDFSGHTATEGLGPITSGKNAYGLLAHSGYAMTPGGLPLGVPYLKIWARKPEEKGSKKARRKKPIEEKESYKWLDGLRGIQESLGDLLSVGRRLLVIADREADIYEYMAAPRHENTDLLVRAAHPRNVEVAGHDGKTSLFEAVGDGPVLGEVEVSVPRKGNAPVHKVTLELRAAVVSILPPVNGVTRAAAKPQTMTVVQAGERTNSEEDEAISWTLLTTLPIPDAAAAAQLVEYYTRRWGIERLHYTLKSGLQIERLQFDDAHTLSNALAIYWIVAWRIMHLTYVAREDPTSPAHWVLEKDELTVLALKEGKPVKTAQEAVTAIAKLAGYRPTPKGLPPGVKVLWIGIRKLEGMVEGWRLATQGMKE